MARPAWGDRKSSTFQGMGYCAQSEHGLDAIAKHSFRTAGGVQGGLLYLSAPPSFESPPFQ